MNKRLFVLIIVLIVIWVMTRSKGSPIQKEENLQVRASNCICSNRSNNYYKGYTKDQDVVEEE
jgi:flagellar biogenesis protein FliO